jgi:hypothetical protein
MGRVAVLILIEMKSRDEFSFAVASSIYRVSASFDPDNSAQVFQALKEAYPNPISGRFFELAAVPRHQGH